MKHLEWWSIFSLPYTKTLVFLIMAKQETPFSSTPLLEASRIIAAQVTDLLPFSLDIQSLPALT